MKVELNHNLWEVINECAMSLNDRIPDDDEKTKQCRNCPLGGACLEVLTGDDSENR